MRAVALLAMVTLALPLLSPSLLAQGEVTFASNTWTATVDGVTVYSGSRMFDAVNAACGNAAQGATINVRNSGNSGPDGGNVYAIRPLINQIVDFHGNTVHCDGGDLVVPVHADRRDGITVKNLHVTGNPRYGLWFRGCSNVTLHNITMDLSDNNPVGLGIRVDSSTRAAGNLTISGNIDIQGAKGHAIETYGIDGFSIGDVTVNNTGGCGLLLNDSRNGTVGNVVGSYNDQDGGYATFRVANNNGPNVTVQSVYSRFSGRGLFSVTDSHGLTVNSVDIADASGAGIALQDTTDTHILSGTVVRCNPNIAIWGTSSNNTVNVETDDGGPIADGTYRLRNRANGLYLDNLGSTANGADVGQWSSSSSNNQKWRVFTNGSYRKLECLTGAKVLDSMGRTADGSNVGQWDNGSSHNQDWTIQNVEGAYYRVVNRANGKAVDNGAQNFEGAIMQHWYVNSSYNQQWTFEPVEIVEPTAVHIASIVTSTEGAGRGQKRGTATVTIHDDQGNPVAGATVTGDFSGDFSETKSGTTGSNGSVTLKTDAAKGGSVSFMFCVANVTHSTLSYDSAANVTNCQ